MKLKSRCIALSAVMLMAAPQAHATLVSFGASIGDNTQLGAGTYTGSFDWSGILQPDLQINSASYSFTFTDDTTDTLTVGTRSPAGTQDTQFAETDAYLYNGDAYRRYERTHTDLYTRTNVLAGEGAAVTLGSASMAAGSGVTPTTSTQSTSTTSAGYTQYRQDSSGFWSGSRYNGGTYHLYRTFNNVTETVTLNNATGTFTVSGSITDPALFAELTANQGLTFSLGIQGDLLLSSGRLSLDVSQGLVSAVPEPSSFVLMGAGLLVCFARRRRLVEARDPV